PGSRGEEVELVASADEELLPVRRRLVRAHVLHERDRLRVMLQLQGPERRRAAAGRALEEVDPRVVDPERVVVPGRERELVEAPGETGGVDDDAGRCARAGARAARVGAGGPVALRPR